MYTAGSNETQDCYGLNGLCCSSLMWVVCGAAGVLLLLSLSCNIVFCAQSYRRGNTSKFLPHFRRSFSYKPEEVEENPVYGNINLFYTGVERGTMPQSTAKQREVKRQVCYAKLELPASRDRRGRKLTSTQYTDILNMLAVGQAGQEASEGSYSDVPSPTANTQLLDLGSSDLYASVRLGRREERGWREDYANKDSLKI